MTGRKISRVHPLDGLERAGVQWCQFRFGAPLRSTAPAPGAGRASSPPGKNGSRGIWGNGGNVSAMRMQTKINWAEAEAGQTPRLTHARRQPGGRGPVGLWPVDEKR